MKATATLTFVPLLPSPSPSLSLPSPFLLAEMSLLIPFIVGIVVAVLSVAAVLFVPRSPNSEYVFPLPMLMDH